MITVKRLDNERLGTYVCYYYHNGREIAYYDSKRDCLNLRTEFIEREWKKPVYDRAMNGRYKEAYEELFAMLNADQTSTMSEYMNL